MNFNVLSALSALGGHEFLLHVVRLHLQLHLLILQILVLVDDGSGLSGLALGGGTLSRRLGTTSSALARSTILGATRVLDGGGVAVLAQLLDVLAVKTNMLAAELWDCACARDRKTST